MIKNTDFTKTTSHGRYAHMDIKNLSLFLHVQILKYEAILSTKLELKNGWSKNKTPPPKMVYSVNSLSKEHLK